MYHIIVNPVSGKRGKRGLKNLAVVERVFKDAGKDYLVHATATVGDGTEIARRLTLAGENKLVVIGGDGTLHEVLNGIAEPSQCRLGLIPSGTGNDFAATLGIPLDAEKAARLVVEGKVKPVDYLEVGGVRCMNVGGTGIDVDVLIRCQQGKFFKGKIKYMMSLLKSLSKFKGCKIEIEANGEKKTHNALIAVACNGTRFGGGIRICPPAKVDDGKLDVLTVECLSKRQMIKAFMKLLRGKITTYPLTEHFLADRVRIIPETPQTVQLDGELYDGLDFTAEIKSGLSMYRP